MNTSYHLMDVLSGLNVNIILNHVDLVGSCFYSFPILILVTSFCLEPKANSLTNEKSNFHSVPNLITL